MTSSNGIGELSESSLHNSLKKHYQEEGDELESSLLGYVVDVKKENTIIEIQTSSFSSVKKKYNKILRQFRIKMVYPIAKKKLIVKQHKSGTIEKRKSPKSGDIYDLFKELVSIPTLINHKNFILEVVFTEEEEIRINDGRGSWRRKGWSIKDHKLIKILDKVTFNDNSDFKKLLPSTIPNEFTTAHLVKYLKLPKYKAQKMVYCLNKMHLIQKIGKDGRHNLYRMK